MYFCPNSFHFKFNFKTPNLEWRNVLGLEGSLLATMDIVFSSGGWRCGLFASAGAEMWDLLGIEALCQEFGLCYLFPLIWILPRRPVRCTCPVIGTRWTGIRQLSCPAFSCKGEPCLAFPLSLSFFVLFSLFFFPSEHVSQIQLPVSRSYQDYWERLLWVPWSRGCSWYAVCLGNLHK